MTVVPLEVVVPLLAAAALAMVGSWVKRWMADVVAIGAVAASAVFGAIVLARSGSQLLVYWFGGWNPSHGVAIGVAFAIDPIGAGFALFAATLMLVALLFSVRYLELEAPWFAVIMLVFLVGMEGLSLSGDLFDMFVFLELMSVSAYALAGYKIEERAPLEGSLNFGITNSVGSFLVVIGIALIYAHTGALNLADIGQALRHGAAPRDGVVIASFALIAAGFFVKAAVVPFHFWLADAYAVAPTPVCILFAGAMSELGLYAVGRIAVAAFGVPDVATVLVVFGLVTAVLGGVMALVQEHLKRMLAFTVISYIGVFLAAGGLLDDSGIAAAAVYVVADGLVKAELFVCVGIVQHRKGQVGMGELHGRGGNLPGTGVLFALGGLALAACPPFGTFLGKSMVEDALIDRGYDAAIPFVILASILCGAAVLRAAASVFLGWGAPAELVGSADEETESETSEAHDRTPFVMWLPAVAMLGLALAIGVIPGLEEAALRAGERFVDQAGYLATVLHGAATSVGETSPAKAPTWYDDLYGAISAAGAIALAALVLRRRDVFGVATRERTEAALGRLRALHSGHVGDYVAWLVLGAAALGGAFALALA